jgi:hypothetical protein
MNAIDQNCQDMEDELLIVHETHTLVSIDGLGLWTALRIAIDKEGQRNRLVILMLT